jgi:ABC-2 type transport system permease protein
LEKGVEKLRWGWDMSSNRKTITKIEVLKANIGNSYRIQTAYFFENWASIASTTFYTLSMLLFIKIVYANVDLFAGYTESEMLLLALFGQLNFYTEWLWSVNGTRALISDVNTGDLDMILIKPVPLLFFVTFRDISLINRLKDSVPNLLLLAMLINWSQINLTPGSIFAGVLIFVCGQAAWHGFRFLFALPGFFIGQSNHIFQLSGTLGDTNNIPLEGFTGALRNIFVSAIPSLIAAQMSVSVILGKSNPVIMSMIALGVASVFMLLKKVGWEVALKNYTSASS